ncbi:ribonuclease H-like protein [Daedalea quercina L-15889]|uniref:3'-5' exonuclease n=1 Tax=Daedalea quercina L-15889 TaxID=1314783 RepID=A0A165P058_9APHY|nr:ribonuclease H-like protein [Daedalea quercina L-15889]
MAATIDLQQSTYKAIKAPAWPLYSWREKAPNARLVYTRDADEANAEIEKLRPGPLGLDMEWKPCFSVGELPHPVALVQLANDEVILLIQVRAMSKFPEKLRELLGSSLYVKAGVAITGDCEKLYRDYKVITRNCVDLSLLARTVDNARWKGGYRSSIGLNRLCEAYEELSLRKGKITRSNWELILSHAQQDYAANDGHSGYTLYCRLAAMAVTMSPIPQTTWYTFDFVGRTLDPETGMEWSPVNPNYDPGPPPPRLVQEDGTPVRKPKKQRPRKQVDLPHAANVSVMQSVSSSRMEEAADVPRSRVPHAHLPLWVPPQRVGTARNVATAGSSGRDADDVPLFVPRDSPDYHKYRSVREPGVRGGSIQLSAVTLTTCTV